MVRGRCHGFAKALVLASRHRGHGGCCAHCQPVSVSSQAERRLQALEGKESRAQRQLQELAQNITALQERGQDTRRLAQQARDGAQRATATAGTLSQVRPQNSTKELRSAGGG